MKKSLISKFYAFKESLRGYIVEAYFCFWSRLYFKRWRPLVIVVTGSVGKTSLLSLLKYQLVDQALHSDRANTKLGITLHALGIKAVAPHERWRWLGLFFLIPLKALISKVHPQPIYLVEYDIYDRHSAKWFKWWLKPDICLWLSITPAHLQHFDKLARRRRRAAFTLAQAEFAKIVQAARQRIFALADNQLMRGYLQTTTTPITWVKVNLVAYEVTLKHTLFKFEGRQFQFSQPLPVEMAESLELFLALARYCQWSLRSDFMAWQPPLARSTLLAGYKGSYLLDSTHNAQPAAMMAMLTMLKVLVADQKWVVLGDMIEQGDATAEAHQNLARTLLDLKPDRIFLIGHRLQRYTCPILDQHHLEFRWQAKINQQLLNDLRHQLQGGEVILFKGAGYLYILIENLLVDETAKQLLNLSSVPASNL